MAKSNTEQIVKVVPTPEQVKLKRELYNLTQKQAAELVFTATRTWQQWESGDRGMHAAFWELFCIKVEKIKND